MHRVLPLRFGRQPGDAEAAIQLNSEDKSPAIPGRATVKRLFALSGNRCAMPDCPSPLIDRESGAVIGKVCHIKGGRPGAKRYDPAQSDLERHGFANLILLCPVCHDIIDTNDAKYTVSRLVEIKAEHERHLSGSEEERPTDELADALLTVRPRLLKLVDVGIVESHGEYPRLDIKVLNLGSVPVFVYEVVVKVLRSVQFLEGKNRFRAQPVTYIYDLDLYAADHPYEMVLEVSQIIPPLDGDRFQIRLGNEEINFHIRETLYQIQVGLVSSDSHDLGLSEPIILSVPMPKNVLGMRSVADPECDEQNRRSVAKMAALAGKKSARIEELARKLANDERL
jgi:hypothetical protein